MKCLLCDKDLQTEITFSNLLCFKREEELVCESCISSFETIGGNHCPSCFKKGMSIICQDCQFWCKKGVNVASKILDLLIEDFLAFVVLRFNVYPESWSKDRCNEFSNALVKDGLIVDPLSDIQPDIRSYDIKRVASIYFDTSGSRVWTKAWFNGSEKGENAIEINRDMAIKFNKNEISRDVWLSRFFPKQMQNVRKAVSEAKMQVFGIKQ